MGRRKKNYLPTEAELFVLLDKQIQQLNASVQDLVQRVQSTIHVDEDYLNVHDEDSDVENADHEDNETDDEDYETEEDTEFFSEEIVDSSCEDDVKGDDDSFVDQIGEPIFDVYNEDNEELLTVARVADGRAIYDEPIYDTYSLTTSPQADFNESILLLEDFESSNGITSNFDLKDTTIPFPTTTLTTYKSQKIFCNNSTSNKREDHIAGLKPKLVRVFHDEDTYMDLQKQHINCVVWKKDCNRKIKREPPDRDQNKGFEVTQEDTKLLTARIIKLQEALVLEQEKNQALEYELNETRKKIRMLNKGSETLDRILSMGRTEKTTSGLGYQGSTFSSHTVFVRSSSRQGVTGVEPAVTLEDANSQDKELSSFSKVPNRFCGLNVSQHQASVDQGWSTGFMFGFLGSHGDLLGDEFSNLKWNSNDVFEQKGGPCELSIEHDTIDNVRLPCMRLTHVLQQDSWFQPTIFPLLFTIRAKACYCVLSSVSFTGLYMRKFDCDFVSMDSRNVLLQKPWQDVEDMIKLDRGNEYMFVLETRRFVMVQFPAMEPLINMVNCPEVMNSGLRCLVPFSNRFHFHPDAHMVLHNPKTYACSHQSTYGMLLIVRVGKALLDFFAVVSVMILLSRDYSSDVLLLPIYMLQMSEKREADFIQIAGKLILIRSRKTRSFSDYNHGAEEETLRSVLSCFSDCLSGFERGANIINAYPKQLFSFWHQEIQNMGLYSVFLTAMDFNIFQPPSVTCLPLFIRVMGFMAEDIGVWCYTSQRRVTEYIYLRVPPSRCTLQLVLATVTDFSDTVVIVEVLFGLLFCSSMHSQIELHLEASSERKENVRITLVGFSYNILKVHIREASQFCELLSLVTVNLCEESAMSDIDNSCIQDQPRPIYVVLWCCVTVLERGEPFLVIFLVKTLCFLEIRRWSLRSVVYEEELAHVFVHAYPLPCVRRVDLVGIFLHTSLAVLIFPTISVSNDELHCEGLKLRGSAQSQNTGSNFTSMTFIFLSNISYATSKILCLVLNKDIMSLHGYTSLLSRKGGMPVFFEHSHFHVFRVQRSQDLMTAKVVLIIFMGVQLLSDSVMEDVDFTVSIHSFHECYDSNCLHKYAFMYNWARYKKHWKIKERNKIGESLKDRENKTDKLLLMEFLGQSCSFRFEVESFKPGGT